MSQSRKQLAQQAIAKAMQVRRQHSVPLHVPLNVFDFAERFEVAVRFVAIPSMEGVYQADAQPKPTILISSLRPAGRKAMTCGHELGHHIFGHGTQWDELVSERTQTRRFEPEEYLVDVFSASLQMPKMAVSRQLSARSIDVRSCDPEQVYAVSTLFGVSYGGFITHLERTLNMINMQRASGLLKHQPKELRASLLGRPCSENLIVVDRQWEERPVDLEVGDIALVPQDATLEGEHAAIVESSSDHAVVSALSPGYCRLSHSDGWATHVRICRKDYEGLARVRFFEEIDDDE